MKKMRNKQTLIYKSGVFALGGLMVLGMMVVSGSSNDTFAAACNRYAKTIGEAICLQDMNDSVKASMQLERQYQLKDFRDGKSYYIAKLMDGNVWMTQNLDLDLSTDIALTPYDTDIKSNWVPKRATYRSINDWQNLSGEPESLDIGDLYWNGQLMPLPTGVEEFSSIQPEEGYGAAGSYVADSGDLHYHLGNYYNWSATMATNDANPFVESEEPSDQSICPVGWMLPDTTYEMEVKGQFKTIDNLLGYYLVDTESPIENAFVSPVYFNPAGVVVDNSNESIGTGEMIWGKVIGDKGGGDIRKEEETKGMAGQSLAALATVVWSYSAESGYAPDYLGFSVRCVARDRAAEEVVPIEDSNWRWVEGQEYVSESGDRSILRFSIPLSDFESVAVDDKLLTRDKDYIATNDGTTLSFKAAYLDTLALGKHDVTANFSGGRTVETTLTILDSPNVPNTGKNTTIANNAVAMMGLPVIGTIILAAGFYKNYNKDHRKFD